MPLRNFEGKMVVLPNYDYKGTYWPIVTELVKAEIKDEEERNPEIVQQLLKQCFSISCEILLDKISEQKRASFFIFCHSVHEDSIDIWSQMFQGYSLGENDEDFAASRRILKIIIEQSSKLNLTGTNSFIEEINENLDNYVETLEELLYIGTYCYLFSEYTTRSLLFNDAIL